MISVIIPALNEERTIGNVVQFSQPLSGIIAVKRELFKRVTLEDNYGVDIGIVLDAALLGARIVEVNIGFIKHKMKQWQELSFMSREVARAILKRVTQSSMVNLDSLETIKIPSFFARTDKSQCNHNFCKSNAMLQIAGCKPIWY